MRPPYGLVPESIYLNPMMKVLGHGRHIMQSKRKLLNHDWSQWFRLIYCLLLLPLFVGVLCLVRVLLFSTLCLSSFAIRAGCFAIYLSS